MNGIRCSLLPLLLYFLIIITTSVIMIHIAYTHPYIHLHIYVQEGERNPLILKSPRSVMRRYCAKLPQTHTRKPIHNESIKVET